MARSSDFSAGNKMIKTISVKEVEYLAFRLAQETMSFNELIPDFLTRYPNVLESCLSAPFQTFLRKSLYPSFIKKTSILFYLLIKNYPFQNGNKRMAMTTLFVFLFLNKKWIRVDTQKLYNFSVWVALSPPEFKQETVQAIEKFMKKYIVNLGEP